MRGIIGIGLLGMSLFTGCVFWGDSYHKKEVTEFNLEPKDNPGLPYLVPGRVDPQTHSITLRLPPSVSTKTLVPRVRYNGLSARLDGLPVGSAPWAVDLSEPHTLEITGLDDTLQRYSVQASYQSLVLESFDFSSPMNPSVSYSISGTTNTSYYWNNGWWSQTYGWVKDYSIPSKAISVNFLTAPPSSIVPNFTHNAARVLWNGQPLVSGVTALPTNVDQVVNLVGADGTTQEVTVTYIYPLLTPLSFGLLATDNPSLRKDYLGNIATGTKIISVAVPQYVDATALAVRFTHNGTRVKINGVEAVSGTTKVDLSHSGTLTLEGYGGRTQDYQILVTPVTPSSSKQLLSRRLYGSVVRTPPFVPGNSDGFGSLYETSPATDVFTLTYSKPYYSDPIDPSLVYLEFETSAIQVSAGVQTLTPGLLTDGAYSPSNWLNFTKPVVLTLTAEDLSTKTITLNLVVQ